MLKDDMDMAEIKRLDRWIWSVAITVLVSIVVLAVITKIESKPDYTNGFPSVKLDYCATEDSTNCYWDSEVSGNGHGRSFIDVDGVVYYFPSK